MDGLGKTTLLRQLDILDLATVFEVDPKNALIKHTLNLFYENRLNSFFYQTLFLYANMERYKKAIEFTQDHELVISDRSFLEDIIFAEALLNEKEFQNFRKLFHIHIRKIFGEHKKPDFYILLRGTFQTSINRSNKRTLEKGVDLNGKNFFDHNIDFYKRLYEIYNNKNGIFYNTLEEHNIKLIEFDTTGATSKDVFNGVSDILRTQVGQSGI